MRVWAKCNGKLTFQQLVRLGISMKSISSALAYWFLQVRERERVSEREEQRQRQRERLSRVSFCKIKLIRLKASISRPRQVTTRRSTVARTKLFCQHRHGNGEGRGEKGQEGVQSEGNASIDFWTTTTTTTTVWGETETGPVEMLDTWQCRCCPRQLHR